MSSIYERIGEALLSNGQHDIIRAENKHEEDTLTKAGFTKVGSIKEGENIVALFKIEQKTKEVIKVVEVPKKDTSIWPNERPVQLPYGDRSYPFGRPDPGIWYYNEQNPLYTYATTSDSDFLNKLSGSNEHVSTVTNGMYNVQQKVDVDYTKIADSIQAIHDSVAKISKDAEKNKKF